MKNNKKIPIRLLPNDRIKLEAYKAKLRKDPEFMKRMHENITVSQFELGFLQNLLTYKIKQAVESWVDDVFPNLKDKTDQEASDWIIRNRVKVRAHSHIRDDIEEEDSVVYILLCADKNIRKAIKITTAVIENEGHSDNVQDKFVVKVETEDIEYPPDGDDKFVTDHLRTLKNKKTK